MTAVDGQEEKACEFPFYRNYGQSASDSRYWSMGVGLKVHSGQQYIIRAVKREGEIAELSTPDRNILI